MYDWGMLTGSFLLMFSESSFYYVCFLPAISRMVINRMLIASCKSKIPIALCNCKKNIEGNGHGEFGGHTDRRISEITDTWGCLYVRHFLSDQVLSFRTEQTIENNILSLLGDSIRKMTCLFNPYNHYSLWSWL